MALTPYELGQEVARIQIGPAGNPEMSVEKATEIAHLMKIEGDQQIEFLEGYQNKFAEEKQRRQIVQEGTDAWLASADQIPNPSWLPNEEELAEAEREMIAFDESLQAGKEVDNSNLHCIICSKKPPEVKLFRATGYGYQICEEHSKGYSQLVEIEESHEAYQQMARDETEVIKAQPINGAYFL